MKFIKISMIILTISIISSVSLAYANETSTQNLVTDVYVYEELTRNTANKTSTYEKKYENNQTFTQGLTSTTITSPCNDCKIQSSLHNNTNGLTTPSLITVKGQSKIYEDSAIVGKWYMNIKRYDYTLVSTTTGGIWVLNRATS